MDGQLATGAKDRFRAGLGFGIAAYGMWGLFPILFKTVADANPFEVLAHRIIWSLIVCLVIIAFTTRRLPWQAIRSVKSAVLLTVAALLIAANWTLYVYGVNTDRVVETALGYYLNPLLSIAIGVLFFRERLSPMMWTAVGLAVIAVVILAVEQGGLPWIAVGLATLFASYGAVKKVVGVSVSAVDGLTVETALLLPIAGMILAVLGAHSKLVFGTGDASLTVMLIFMGALTAGPLLVFAAAAARLPLTLIGLLQYIAPTMQFLIGVLYYGESMSPLRWAGFGFVWAALTLIALRAVWSLRHAQTP